MAAKKTVVKKDEAKNLGANVVVKVEDYMGEEFTDAVMQDMLIKRGFDDKDVVDLSGQDLRDQLIEDDKESGNAPKKEVSEAPKKEDVKAPKGSFVDIVKGEEYIRTYSLEVHGADYKEIAASFVAKDPRRAICSFPIREVRVSYRFQNKKPGENHGVWMTETKVFTNKDEAIKFRSGLSGDSKPVMIARK